MELSLTTGKRKIKDGSWFNHMFPSEANAYGKSSVLKDSGNVTDTVKFIAEVIEKDRSDTKQIAQYLNANNRTKILQNIHNFMVNYLQYDTESGEKLRSPRRTWWVGQKQIDHETGDKGVDCDDLVIFSGSILRNLNIPFFIRIVKVNQNEFQHVYIVVPPSGEQLSGTYITLDGVLSDFDYEYPFKEEKTFNQKGMKIEYLGELAPTIQQTDPILKLLVNIRKKVSAKKITPSRINASDLLRMLDYVIKNWEFPLNRLAALESMAEIEKGSGRKYGVFTSLYAHYSNQPYLTGLKGGNWDDIPVEDYQGDYINNGDTDNDGKWATALTAMFTALANFDWGLVGGQSGNNNSYPPVQYQQPKSAGLQIAGMSISTIGGLFLLGGMGYLLYENVGKKKRVTKALIK